MDNSKKCSKNCQCGNSCECSKKHHCHKAVRTIIAIKLLGLATFGLITIIYLMWEKKNSNNINKKLLQERANQLTSLASEHKNEVKKIVNKKAQKAKNIVL